MRGLESESTETERDSFDFECKAGTAGFDDGEVALRGQVVEKDYPREEDLFGWEAFRGGEVDYYAVARWGLQVGGFAGRGLS